jgi:TPR repeat protein
MRVFWKVSITVISGIVVLGAVAIWHAYKTKADARKLAEDVRITLAHAQRGDAEAENRLGGMYYYGQGVPQGYLEALRWYRAAADQGDAKAQYNVGYLYDTGKGVQQDVAKAYHWYEQAANKGDRQAECGLAAMYYDGRGVPQDYAKAAVLYRRSADQGLPRAQYDLGYMYYHGQGLPQDRVEARLWIRKAVNQGDEHAREALGMKLTPWLIFLLAVQGLGGFAIASRPLSFNMWEQNEGAHDSRDWMSIGTGVLILTTAGMSWYGYTHNLIWCWIYGVTGFALLKWSLNTIALVLLYIVFFHRKPSAPEEAQEKL